MTQNLDILDNIIFGRVHPRIYGFSTNTFTDFLKVGDTYRPVRRRLEEWRRHYPDLVLRVEDSAAELLVAEAAGAQLRECRRGAFAGRDDADVAGVGGERDFEREVARQTRRRSQSTQKPRGCRRWMSYRRRSPVST